MPVRSRRSTKTSPPWSRRRSTQPGERQLLADELLRRLAAHVGAPDRRAHEVDSLPRTSAWASCSSAASRRRIVAVSRADDDDGLGARAAGLGQLTLERAAGVVGVGGHAAVAQLLQPGERELARRVRLDGEEDVDRRRLGASRPPPPSRSAAARCRHRSRRRASAGRRSPRRGSRSGRRRRWSSSRSPSDR